MHEPVEQLPQPLEQGKAEYVPLHSQVVREFARDVCAGLVRRGYSDCEEAAIVNGFADFMDFISRVTAKQLSRSGKPTGER